MRKRTAEDEEFLTQMAEILGQDDADRFADAWLSMSDEVRSRYARLATRMAALPKDAELTQEQIRIMVECDVDPPMH